MGFFSWQCRGCEKSILSIYATSTNLDRNGSAGNAWMTKCVALAKNGSVVMGEYDGYGRVDGACDLISGPFENADMWHRDCWEKAGQPDYVGSATHAADQGYFFNDDEYDIPSPLSIEENL